MRARQTYAETERRRGLYAGFLIALAVGTLVAVVFLPRLYTGPLSKGLLTLVLAALAAAIAMHARFLFLVRRQQRETASALRTTEHEFESVFDSTLDGLLILNDDGTCVEANPAALSLLRVGRHDLIGREIGRFQATEGGGSPLGARDGCGETIMVCEDGETILVEYSAKANYLPGRHCVVLRDITARRQAETALIESEERFRQMAGNIEEIFWMLDAQSKGVIFVNRAYETITGRTCDSLRENPTSYQELFHSEDRIRVMTRLEEAGTTGQLDEEFRIVRPDGSIRWVAVRGFPVRDPSGIIRRLVGTAHDISARKSAEEQMATSLHLAEAARAEADALRRATLALTQDLSMDHVLDTLLASLLRLVPCDSAEILLAETDDRLFLARQRRSEAGVRLSHKSPRTWNATDHPALLRAILTRSVVHIRDTAGEQAWAEFKGHSQFRSWLAIPLLASESLLGLLCLGDLQESAFTMEHVRLAKLLAIPAAVAIQNARLYERAAIYGAELEKRIADIQTHHAPEKAQAVRRSREE